MTISRQVRNWTAVWVTLLVAGCSSGDRLTLGQVEGVITLDGQPLDMCSVVFKPESGQTSNGFTDSEGQYELRYGPDLLGAVVGEHRVTVFDSSGHDRVPKKYNLESAVTATVKEGPQTIDFPLISEP